MLNFSNSSGTTVAVFEQARQLQASGWVGDAERLYRQVLAAEPNHAAALHALGLIAGQSGRLDQAIELIGRAVKISPGDGVFWCNYGFALRLAGRGEDAILAYRNALAQAKSDEALQGLGNALADRGRRDEALAVFEEAVTLAPGNAQALYNLALTQDECGNDAAAVATYQRAAAIEPRNADVQTNLGISLRKLGRYEESLAALALAAQLAPNAYQTQVNLSMVQWAMGAARQAIATGRRAMQLDPSQAQAHSNYLYMQHVDPDLGPREVAEAHFAWDRLHAAKLRSQPGFSMGATRRLRIGYVSPDLREHSVSRFLMPLLAHRDKNVFEIFAYADVPKWDAVTARIRTLVDHWRDLAGMSDEKAAALIRADQIDILIDLAGHTAHNRLMVFARKPARVQMSAIGYPNTTGLSAMDFRLTDALADPPGRTEMLHSEKLLRPAACAWCFEPMTSSEITPRDPAAPMTFGSFNNAVKITDAMLAVWAKILQAAPGSRLLLKSRCGASTLSRLRQTLVQNGISPERLDLRGFEPSAEAHHQLYSRMDIALDTFPYHGTTTTCEALWMGVPVITLAGATHVSRVGVSLLSAVGLSELIAEDTQRYCEKAVALARDTARLAELRATLRERMLRSPLMDAAGYTHCVEAALKQVAGMA